MWWEVLLYLAAFLCFLLAAFSVAVHPRVQLIGLGLAAWVLVPLIHTLDTLT